jgi:hypothetical protein
MANPQNLIPQAHVLTVEEASKGGKASVKARNYKKEQIENLKRLLDQTNDKGISYRELMNLGILKGALKGKAENFKAIMDYLDDTTQASGTPSIEIRVIDNSNLEKAMYDNNDKV